MSTSTWKTDPSTNNWGAADNWDPAEIPTDTAKFSTTSTTSINFSSNCAETVNSVDFEADAPCYTLNFDFPVPENQPALTIAGEGVSNHSGKTQHFVVSSSAISYSHAQLKFTNSASAGGMSMLYSAGPTTAESAGGGVIRFVDESTAGSANFIVTTGAGTPPSKNSTVGAEVSFGDNSLAGSANFTIYGSTSLTDGDTFGNTVFHDSSTAANATFTNIGGTVPGGDGGNTQLYDTSTAGNGVFLNKGGAACGKKGDGETGANGGDVAFDGTANGSNGKFYNYPATVAGAYGGVTSFNNNYPPVESGGASAGSGHYINYGAKADQPGGGGHIKFTSIWGSPTAANGTFINFGSDIWSEHGSCAGYTVFSVTKGVPKDGKYGSDGLNYSPSAGNATFHNHPATSKDGTAGVTKFAVYPPYEGSSHPITRVPTAESGVFYNYGGQVAGARGGYTEFSDHTDAANATLVAMGGSNGGYGGRIVFYDNASGGSATVKLSGNGELEVGDHTGELKVGSLELTEGIISIQLGTNLTSLALSVGLTLNSAKAHFSFWKKDDSGFEFNTPYTVLTAANLSSFTTDQFSSNSIDNVEPTFSITGNNLQVSFNR